MSELTSPEGYELFRQWNLYQRVVHFNHMRHRELIATLQTALNELGQPLRVLDLGCGAGELAWKALETTSVNEYVGIDLSESAVEQLLARQPPGTMGPAVPVVGICGEMLRELQKLSSARFDLVIASYSLHHFPGPQKVPVLQEIARVISPGGAFIWIDLLRADGESANHYLERTCARIRQEWHSLSPEEREATCAHALTCDYPEQASTMQQMLAGSTLLTGKLLYRDDFYGSWLFRSAKFEQSAGDSDFYAKAESPFDL